MRAFLLSSVLFVACAHAPTPASRSEFHVGALRAVALKDGDIDVEKVGEVFGLGQPAEALREVAPGERTTLSIQPLLVWDGARVLLFDTGAGTVAWARGGKLQRALAEVNVTPDAVTDIFISHGHLDHVGGLVTPTGALAFPNAQVHLAAAEWASLQHDAEAAELVKVIASKVAPFEPGARLLPTVTAVDTSAHTPGHSSYELESNGQKLFFTGDLVHHVAFSMRRPEWPIAWDLDRDRAATLRQQMLERLARDHELVFSGHFPFPGVGHVRALDHGFAWEPE